MIQMLARRWAYQVFALGIALGLLSGTSLRSEETAIATIEHPEAVDFQHELLPILRKKCLACHNGTDAESDLVLETPETIAQGGSQGPAVVAGKPDESLVLILAARRDEPVMPPEDNSAGANPLTSEELALLQLWIEQGATGKVAGTEPIHWQPLPAGVNPVYAAAQSPDGRFVVAGRANQAWVYDVILGRYCDRLIDPSLADSPVAVGGPLAHLDLVQSLAFSHNGQWIASGGYRTVKLWHRADPVSPASALPVPNVTEATHCGSDTLACADEAGQIHRLAGPPWASVDTLTGHSGPVYSLATSPHGTWLASSGTDNTLRTWTNSNSPADTQNQSTVVRQLAWTADNTLAGACEDKLVRIWPVDDQGKLGSPRNYRDTSILSRR